MSAAPFDVEVVAARLRAKVPELQLVGTAADYMAVEALGRHRAPCAYVILPTERGLENPSGVAPPGEQVDVSQFVVADFGVISAVRHYREGAGGQVQPELGRILGLQRRAILGWTPNLPGARPCKFVRGDLLDYDSSTALWADVFRTQHSISNR